MAQNTRSVPPLSRRGFLGTAAAGGLAVMSGGLLTACGDDDGGGSSSGGTTELLYLAPGDAPAGWDDVLSKVNQKLTDDSVGYTLRVQWINWNEFNNVLLLKATSGEDFDATLDAPWAHMQRLITSNTYIALDDKLDDYPNLRDSLPQESWDANKFFGKLYGVPQGVSHALTGFAARTDLTQKHGFGELTTYQDVEDYLYAIKENEPDMIPFGIDKANAGLLLGWGFNAELWNNAPTRYANSETFGRWDAEAGKIIPEWEDETWVAAVERVRKYNQDGLINSDFLNITKDDVTNLFGSGKFGAVLCNAGDQMTADSKLGAVRQSVDGADVDAVYPLANGGKPFSSFAYWNFVCLNAAGKNPEGILALQDWLSIRENHDLLQYGVEGRDWDADGDDGYTAKSQYAFPGFVFSWRPGLERLDSTLSAKDREWSIATRDPQNFTASPIAGFRFDDTTVKTEAAQVNAAKGELIPPLGGGAVDAAEGIANFRSAYEAAGYQKVLDEVQRQADEFLESQ